VFPQRVLVVNRAKSKTFFAFFQNETLNLLDIASKMDIFDVCVHKISRFRARKTKNAPTWLKIPTGFGRKALLS